MTPEDVVFKLGELQPDEITRLMKDSGVIALRRCPAACAVTQYVYNETKKQGISTSYKTLDYDGAERWIALPETVQKFVKRFDDGCYPEIDAQAPENM